jgi:outer membrane protein TolC
MKHAFARKWPLIGAALVFAAGACAFGQAPSTNLALAECLEKALRHNVSIKTQEIEWFVSGWNVRREWAAFEPLLAASGRQEEQKRENTVEEARNQLTNFFEERNKIYDVGIQGLFFSGAKYRLGLSVSDLQNNLTNVTFQEEFQSQYRSFLGAEVTQPLLKGAWLSANMAGVRLASSEREKNFHGLRRQIMDIIAQTEAAYWDLVYLQEENRLRAESVRNAGKVLEDNRARLQAGKMSELEVLQAEAGVAERRTKENETRRELVQAIRRLYTLLSEAQGSVEADLVATDAPRLLTTDLGFDAAMYAAAQLQPDYLMKEQELKEAEIRLAYARTQRWPQLDFVGRYGYSGLAQNFDGSWEDIESNDFPDWSVGLQATVGLGGEQRGLSELRAAELRREQASLGMTNVTVEIANAVHSGLREISMLKEGIEDYAKMAEFNGRLLDAEMQKLDAGKSSSRQVLEVEQDLFEARVAETRSRNRYQRAVIQVELATGTILATRNLELMPYPGETPAGQGAPAAADEPVKRGRAVTVSDAPPDLPRQDEATAGTACCPAADEPMRRGGTGSIRVVPAEPPRVRASATPAEAPVVTDPSQPIGR